MQRSSWMWWVLCGLLAVSIAVGAGLYLTRPWLTATASARELGDEVGDEPGTPSAVHVDVVHPKKGGLDRTSSQPGTVQAYETVDLYAAVSGYLKTNMVPLLGKEFKEKEVIAELSVPDLEKQRDQCKAEVGVAERKVDQMKAAIDTADAEKEAAHALVPQAEANYRGKLHMESFRKKMLDRLEKLLATGSIDANLVDEAMEHYAAAVESTLSAKEAVTSAKAREKASVAKVAQAQADWRAAQAELESAKARLEKAQVMVNFATIRAPFDGVIIHRNFDRGRYIRSATEGSTQPLVTIQRNDKFRIVVQIPDRDVKYCKVGNPAVIELDALGGEKFTGTVARISRSEDSQTRTMPVEIDVQNNKAGEIADGMYGRATILLQHSDLLTVPSSCLAGKAQDGKGSVYVVRNGQAHRVPVEYGQDNGLKVAILSGLTEKDQVILHPGTITEGTAVSTNAAAPAGAGH